jgi:hypothetical protein
MAGSLFDINTVPNLLAFRETWERGVEMYTRQLGVREPERRYTPLEVEESWPYMTFGYEPTILQALTWSVLEKGTPDVISISGDNNRDVDIMSVYITLFARDKSLEKKPSGPWALIMAPSRAVVMMMKDDLAQYDLLDNVDSKVGCLYWDKKTNDEQREMLRAPNKPNILIGTPLVIAETIRRQQLDVSEVEFVAIMGFNEIHKSTQHLTIYKGILAKLPEKKQVVLMAGKFNEEVEAFGQKHMLDPLVIGKCGSGNEPGEVGIDR